MTRASEEPVIVALSTVAGVVDAGLAASNVAGWTHLDGSQLAAIIGFVTVLCAAVARVLRSMVTPVTGS